MIIVPEKLKSGSRVRVIAPSRSLGIISEDCRRIARARFAEMGLTVSFGKNVEMTDRFLSSPVRARLDDLHEAFADKSVDAVLTAIGGFNAVELLSQIDYGLIKANPKIFCGFSDITALSCAIYAKTGLVTYSGPHFSSFGMLKGLDYTLDCFKKCFFQKEAFALCPSPEWSDDPWYLNQDERHFVRNDGIWAIRPGKAEGTIIGGNLGLLDELKGTPYFPDIRDCILFAEHCAEHDAWVFNRNLQSLCLHPDFKRVRALVIGRFEPQNQMNRAQLEEILLSKKELEGLPIIANADFGHTAPIFTFPVGGRGFVDGERIELTCF